MGKLRCMLLHKLQHWSGLRVDLMASVRCFDCSSQSCLALWLRLLPSLPLLPRPLPPLPPCMVLLPLPPSHPVHPCHLGVLA
jgi:hypothetical protein